MHKKILFLLAGISSLNLAYSQDCLEPNNLSLIDASNTEASIEWVSNDTEAQWSVEYGIQGFEPGTGNRVTIDNVTTADINGLTSNSLYDIYVRAICGDGDTSAYSEPISFNTFNLGQYFEFNNLCGQEFVDISATGTNLNLSDDTEAGVTLPFPFYYNGNIVTEMSVGNNGGVILNSLTADVYGGSIYDGYDGLFPYGIDLNTALPGGGVFTHTIGTPGARKFIIQWKDLARYNSPAFTSGGVTFEIVIDEATQEFYFIYADVDMENPNWNNGGDSQIGVSMEETTIEVSMYDNQYLTDNTCAHFYYTDCPRPTDFDAPIANITADEIGFTWEAGLTEETDWVVIWGEHGFDPNTATPNTTSTTSMTVTDLTQLTTYDFYIYAQCDAESRSNPLFASVQTLPLCSNPTNISATADQDSLYPTWSWSAGSGPAATAFNIQYGPQGFNLYGSNSYTETADNNLTDTIHNTVLMSGAYYDVYVQAVCTDDTSLFRGPFTIAMPLFNNEPCAAEALIADGRIYSLTNEGASLSPGENAITPPLTGYNESTGWSSADLHGSTWFTFVAPASGNMRINTSLTFAYNKIAIYSATSCNDFGTFIFASGNENYPGSNFVACGLTPGATYYMMYADGYDWQQGDYKLKLSEVDPYAGTWNGLTNVCIGDTIDLNDQIAGYEPGSWSAESTNIDLIGGSLFPSDGLASTTFNFEYRVSEGCAFDTVVAKIRVYGHSSAGDNGALTVCKNEPFNLLAALTGSIDLGGVWQDPANAPMPSGQVTGANFQGSYNYDYIATNHVCPSDTALVVVTVLNCDYLGLEEAEIAGFNLYPNPTDGLVYIAHEASNEVYTYEVTDMNGRVIATQKHTTDGSTAEVDLRAAQAGMYLVRVFNANAEKTFRVIVK